VLQIGVGYCEMGIKLPKKLIRSLNIDVSAINRLVKK
jgi:hypothetical protein